MAKFTREQIRKILGDACTDEIENALIAAHIAVADPLRDELQRAKTDAEKLPTVQKELDDLKAAQKDGVDYKKMYDDLVAQNAADAERGKKKEALRGLLREIGVSEKRIAAVLKISEADGTVDGLTLDDKGAITTAADLKKSLKTEWSDFIPAEEKHGANTANPPANTGGGKTVDEIMAIQDDAERQAAIAQNHELFGF